MNYRGSYSLDELQRRRRRRTSRSSESEDRARFRLDWRRDVRWSGACRCRRRSCDRLRSDFEFLTPEGVDSLRSRRSSCRRAFNGGWCSSCGGRRWRSWTSRSPSIFRLSADGSLAVSLDKTLSTILNRHKIQWNSPHAIFVSDLALREKSWRPNELSPTVGKFS